MRNNSNYVETNLMVKRTKVGASSALLLIMKKIDHRSEGASKYGYICC